MSKWTKEFELKAEVFSHLMVSGMSSDKVLVTEGDGVRVMSNLQFYFDSAEASGYHYVVVVHPEPGTCTFRHFAGGDVPPDFPGRIRDETDGVTSKGTKSGGRAAQIWDESPNIDRDRCSNLGRILAWVSSRQEVGCVVVEHASRLAVSADRPSDWEHVLFTQIQLMARSGVLKHGIVRQGYPDPPVLGDRVVWLVENPRDLPAWYVADERVQRINVEPPTLSERRQLAVRDELSSDEVETFIAKTDGISVWGCSQILSLMKTDDLGVERAVTQFHYGLVEDPWTTSDLVERIKNGRDSLCRRVLGQEHAIESALQALSSAALGISNSAIHERKDLPKAILFLTGPTGTGKTELSKAIQELVFKNDEGIIQLNMGEYSEAHSVSRLIGSPPGYEGSSQGGQLTERVAERPFSVVLFDEIEKAHREVLKLFLEILDQGWITDSLGRRVSFADTIIIFTSNIGVRALDQADKDGVTSPEERRALVSKAVEVHFDSGMAMPFPEFYGRIRIGLVVFNHFATKDVGSLLDKSIAHTQERLQTRHRLIVEVPAPIRDKWLEEVVPEVRVSGARTVTSLVTSHFQNPIASYLMNMGEGEGGEGEGTGSRSLVVKSATLQSENGVYELELEKAVSPSSWGGL